MKFTPQPSTSPRILAQHQIGTVELNVVHDPKEGARYLSVGVGGNAVRRTWLTPEQASQLLVALATLSPEWSK